MKGHSRQLELSLLVCIVFLAAPLAAEGRGESPPLIKTLEAKEGFTVRYPHMWVLTPGYRDAYKLKRVAPEDLGTPKAFEAAQMMITTEVRRDHRDALQRLKEIDASEDTPATYLEIGGWPALEREYLAPMDRIGPERRQQDPKPLSRRFTLAIAVDNLLVHLQGHLMPEAERGPIDEMRAVGRSFVFGKQGDPAAVESELKNLRESPRLKQPRFLPPGSSDGTGSAQGSEATGEESDGPGLVQRVQGLPGDGVDAEIEIAVSTDGRNIVVANNGRDFATSNDGGLTFTTGTLAAGAPGGGANGDPSVGYGASGNFYFAYIGFPDLMNDGMGNFVGNQCSTAVARSTNSGQSFTWVGNAELCDDTAADPCFPDQEHIAVDRFNLSQNTAMDQVYSTWRNFDGGGCGRFGGIGIAGPDVPSIVCSEDGGVTWTPRVPVHNSNGTYPRITVGQDGSVYVIYREGSNNIRLRKFSSCDTGLVAQPSVAVVSGISRVTCPIPGIDRCNDGSDLTSQMVAVDDTNANHVYVTYAVSTSANVNEAVLVQDSIDGGTTWGTCRASCGTPMAGDSLALCNVDGDCPIFESCCPNAVQVSSSVVGRRFMPWVCTAGGTAHVSWYDMRAANVNQNDLTDYYGSSAFRNAVGNLTAGDEFKISTVSDQLCGPSPGYWPCAPRSVNDSESCWDQPQLAGVCGDGVAPDSNLRCDFSQATPADVICPAGETCRTGGGCPKYGDYSGNACAAGRFYTAWASRTSPPGVTPASTDVDVLYSSKIVCCVPQIQVPAPVDFGEVCGDGAQTDTLDICNTGKEDLVVDPILSDSVDVVVTTPSSGYPVVISPDFCFPFEVTFTPSSAGAFSAILTVPNNDTVNPELEVAVTADVGVAGISTFIADSGDFGNVCVGDFKDLNLTIQNNGTCDLEIDSVSLSGTDAAEFELPDGSLAGTIIESGNSLLVPVRFVPDNFTDAAARTASVDVASSTLGGGPLALDQTPITGFAPPPDINLSMANSGNFGAVCAGDQADLDLTLFNQGMCDLTISNIQLLPDAGSFELPADLQLPLVLSPDADFAVPVRFSPDTCFDTPEMRTVEVTSDDPDEMMVSVDISGVAPCPNLVIDPAGLSGIYAFPPTVVDTSGTLGCFAERGLSLRNNSQCPLTISSISAAGADFLVTAPTSFPILLPGGEETLGVTVRFLPQSDADPLAPSEVIGQLTVVSDDPGSPDLAGLCGESVAQSGVRILVVDQSGAAPVVIGEVDSMRIQSKGIHTPGPINLNFTDQPVSSTLVCGNSVKYHVDQETLPATDTSGNNPSSSYKAKAKEGNLQTEESFTLGQCEFREFQLQLEDSDSPVCLLLPKGAPCTTPGQCCSGRCKGPSGNKTCR